MLSEIYADFGRLCASAGVKEDVETGQYLDNLLRLRLLEVKEVADVELKQRRSSFFGFEEHSNAIELERTRYEALYVTKLGIGFLELCVCPTNVEQDGGPNEGSAVALGDATL